MIDVKIEVSTKAVVGMLRHLHRDQMPFATSLALNQVANDVQAAIRQSLPQHGFTLRRKAFIDRTIYRQPGVDFATKLKLSSGVRIHPQRDVLAKFETDTVKRPQAGRSLLVPIEARKGKGAIVPRGLWPAALGRQAFALKLKSGGKGLFRNKGRGKNRGLQLLYVFKSQVPLGHRLGFEDTARQVAAIMWPGRMNAALARAIRTAR